MVFRAISSVLKSKIFTAERDKTSIILYGTKKTDNPLGFNNIIVLQDLDQADPQRILEVENITKNLSNFKSKYGHANKDTPLFEALWVCHHLFGQLAKQSFNKRIFLFTIEDFPDSKADRDRAIQRSHDLAEQGVVVELFPLNKAETNQNFDCNKF